MDFDSMAEVVMNPGPATHHTVSDCAWKRDGEGDASGSFRISRLRVRTGTSKSCTKRDVSR